MLYGAGITCAFQSTLPTRGSDEGFRGGSLFVWSISIHAPHEGERHTHSKMDMAKNDFNPRSPRGGATGQPAMNLQTKGISIHAPHEGERHNAEDSRSMGGTFQSTLPTRGSDGLLARRVDMGRHFNPRSPRGGATRGEKIKLCCNIFQSTLPTRGSDWIHLPPRHCGGISIHAPHEGERPSHSYYRYLVAILFQSTLPTRGSDRGAGIHSASQANFNPRSPRGGATRQKLPEVIGR